MKKAITVKDIARMAGVSIGTVSRVLNRVDDVAPELVEKTMAVVREMNYTPLRRNGKNIIRERGTETRPLGLFYFSSPNWRNSQVFSDYTRGIKTACREAGYDLMIYMKDDFDVNRLEEWRRRLSGVLVKGDFMVGDPELEAVNALAGMIPTVGFGMKSPLCRFPQVSFDNYLAGSLAAEELIRRGHRRIAFLNPISSHSMFISRSQGYIETMKRYSLWRPELLVEKEVLRQPPEPEAEFPDLDRELERILALNPVPTAVIVANDWNTGGLYLACRRRGIRIPDDLSVVSFDNNIPLCGMMDPPLSSISNPLPRIGMLATRLLVGDIERQLSLDNGMASIHYLPGELADRASINILPSN